MPCQASYDMFTLTDSEIEYFPPANEVWGELMFLHVSVILSTGW